VAIPFSELLVCVNVLVEKGQVYSIEDKKQDYTYNATEKAHLCGLLVILPIGILET
jgi:hypothetical protein